MAGLLRVKDDDGPAVRRMAGHGSSHLQVHRCQPAARVKLVAALVALLLNSAAPAAGQGSDCIVQLDCTVEELSAPANGALDAACADGATLGAGVSCALTCNGGFQISGTQPRCSDCIGDFEPGTIACTAIVCTRPAGAAAYSLTETNLNLGGGAFSVSGSCAAGFFGSVTTTPCTASGPYGLSGCIACEAGQHQPNQGQSSCIDCAAGSMTDTLGSTGASRCTQCGAGQVDEDSDSSTTCTNCAAGTISAATGAYGAADSSRGCQGCTAGQYSTAGTPSCIPCGAGQYSDDPALSCADCEMGTYSTGESNAQCIPCAAGKYVEVTGSDEATDCRDCPRGSYLESERATAATDCISCPDNTFSTALGLDNSDGCDDCYVGQKSTGEVVPSTTDFLGEGEYHSRCDVDDVLPGALVWRPEDSDVEIGLCGFAAPMSVFCAGRDANGSPDGTATAERSCTCRRLDCDAGEQPRQDGSGCELCSERPYDVSDPSAVDPAKLVSDGSSCRPCPVGEQPKADRSDCDGCDLGFSSDGSNCTECPPGTQQKDDQSGCDECRLIGTKMYSNATTFDTVGPKCQPCGLGFQPNANRTACTACSNVGPKRYSDDGAACKECGMGTAPKADRSDCDNCVQGEYSDGTQCLRCEPGKEPTEDRGGCSVCRGNAYSPDGAQCVRCDSGSQAQGADNRTEQQFIAAQDASATDSPLESTVTSGSWSELPEGSWSDLSENTFGGHTSCVKCDTIGDDMHSPDGATCQPCPSGVYPTGKAPNGERTDCVACVDGEYSDGSRCMCAEGFYDASKGTFRCFESEAMGFAPLTDAASQALWKVPLEKLKRWHTSNTSARTCVKCQGDCVTCGAGCEPSGQDNSSQRGNSSQCGKISIRPGFAPYFTKSIEFPDDVPPALHDFFQDPPPAATALDMIDVGVFKCLRKVPKADTEDEGPSVCCGEGRVRNPMCMPSANSAKSLCADGYAGVLCNDCARNYIRTAGACQPCPDGGEIHELSAKWWRLPSIFATVLLSTALVIALCLKADSDPADVDPLPELADEFERDGKVDRSNTLREKISALNAGKYDEDYDTKLQRLMKDSQIGSILTNRVIQHLRYRRQHADVQNLRQSQLDGGNTAATGEDKGRTLCTGRDMLDKPVFYIFTAAGFSLEIFFVKEWVGQKGLMAVATFIFTFFMLLPLIVTTALDLYAGTNQVDKLKVSMGFVQTLIAAKDTFRLDFPLTFRWLIEYMKSWLSFDLFKYFGSFLSLFSVGCLKGYRFYEKWWLTVLSPLALALLMGLYYARLKLRKDDNSARVGPDSADKDALDLLNFDKTFHLDNEDLREKGKLVGLQDDGILGMDLVKDIVKRRREDATLKKIIRLFFLVLFLIFPMVVRTMIDANLCRKLGDDRDGSNAREDKWMMVDLEVSCDHPDYTDYYSFWFGFWAAFYPVGVPMGLLLWLWFERNAMKIELGDAEGWQKFSDRYSFLVQDYKPEYYFWDCIEMMRKVVLAGFLSILGPVQRFFADDSSTTMVWAAPGSQFQLLVGIFTSTVFMVAVNVCTPYAEENTNGFKVTCDFCATMVLVLSVMLKGAELSDNDGGLSSAALGVLMMWFSVVPFFHEAVVKLLAVQLTTGRADNETQATLGRKLRSSVCRGCSKCWRRLTLKKCCTVYEKKDNDDGFCASGCKRFSTVCSRCANDEPEAEDPNSGRIQNPMLDTGQEYTVEGPRVSVVRTSGAKDGKDRKLIDTLWSRARRPALWGTDTTESQKIILEMWSRMELDGVLEELEEPELQQVVETSMGVELGDEQRIAATWRSDVFDDVVSSDNTRMFAEWLELLAEQQADDSDTDSDSVQSEPEPEPVREQRQGTIENPMLAPAPFEKQEFRMSRIEADAPDVVDETQNATEPASLTLATTGRLPVPEPQRSRPPLPPGREQQAAPMSNAQATAMLGGVDPEHGPQTRPRPPPPAGPPPTASRSPPPPTPPVALEPATGENETVQKTWFRPREL